MVRGREIVWIIELLLLALKHAYCLAFGETFRQLSPFRYIIHWEITFLGSQEKHVLKQYTLIPILVYAATKYIITISTSVSRL